MKSVLTLVALSFVAWPSDCSKTSVNFPPFNNPYPPAYKSTATGLYPNGASTRPAAHESLGLQQSALVRPRNAVGAPDDSAGRIVLLSVGMSNTTAEFSAFQQLFAAEPRRNPRLVLVDGAQGGASADAIVANPALYFSGVDVRLTAAGVQAPQVQAVWLKLADAAPNQPFPNDAQQLQAEIQNIILNMLMPRFPNLKLVYLSSRIYAGYADTNLNPEPYAYQSGFSVKWLIAQQLGGAPVWSVAAGSAPWLSWGPYLWGDGVVPRADGLSWPCSDLAADGTHPSTTGQAKVAGMLLDFFRTDSTTRSWFLAKATPPPSPPVVNAVVNAAGYGAALSTGSLASIFGSNLADAAAQVTAMPLPHALATTRVEIDGQPALLYYVSPTQINFVLPPTSGSSLTVVRGETASPAFKLQVGFWAPGLFTLDGRPDGPVAALHATGSVVDSASPARPGESIAIFGAGLGIVNPLLLIPIAAPLVDIAGRPATVTYAGPAPGWPGLTQVNVTVPLDAPTGAAVPIQFKLAGQASNLAGIEIR